MKVYRNGTMIDDHGQSLSEVLLLLRQHDTFAPTHHVKIEKLTENRGHNLSIWQTHIPKALSSQKRVPA